MLSKEYWQSLDLKKNLIPDEIMLKKDSVCVTEGIKAVNGSKLFYREALPENSSSVLSILLLHGRMFSSKTWLDLGTINILAAMGYRTVAVDLPGYANSPAAEIHDRADFLYKIIQNFNLHNLVIVSPSMSGFYTLPYLLKNWKNIAGFVPVAPVGIEVLEELSTCENTERKNQIFAPLQEFLHDPVPDLSHIQTPTMVVFGEKDRSRSSALLSLLPMSQCQEIPNGNHPAYLDDPKLWHQLLYNFLFYLSQTYCLEE